MLDADGRAFGILKYDCHNSKNIPAREFRYRRAFDWPSNRYRASYCGVYLSLPDWIFAAGTAMSSLISAISPGSTASASELDAKRAVLARLVATYSSNVRSGQTAPQLQALGAQIASAANALGESVMLPVPSESVAATGGTPPPSGPLYGDRMPPGYA